MKNKLKNKYEVRAYLFMALFLCFIIIGIWGFFSQRGEPIKPTKNTENTDLASNTTETKRDVSQDTIIKEAASLAMPYTVQAPFANWNVHEESCEEAAVFMYHQYLIGDTIPNLDQSLVDRNLRAMRSWEINNYGVETDLDIEKVGKFASDYYGHKYRVISSGTIDDVKKEISSGSPVLAPVMTHSLLNPHYGIQDTYHILLIKGYDASGVYTNDAGVKEGKDYFYTWDILFSAIDAQTPKMNQGRDFLVLTK